MDNKELLKTILISLIAVIFLTIATIVTLKIIKNVREDKIVEPKQEEKSDIKIFFYNWQNNNIYIIL